jgi:hypothetical protein
MAAVGTGASVGITIWVVSDGRYEPQNFPFYHIEDKDLVWDWSTQSSNYTQLRAQNEAALKGAGWEIESSLGLNESLITDVILSGGQYYGGPGGGGGGASGGQSNAADDYLPVPGTDPDAGAGEGGVSGEGGAGGMTADEVRAADIQHLFAGMSGPNVRVTRMRSDISHAAMTVDFVLRASADQSELPNVRTVTNQVNLQCPVYDACNVVGYAPYDPNNPNMNGSGGSHGGCVAAPQASKESGISFGVFAGAIGIIIARNIRERKKRAAAKK